MDARVLLTPLLEAFGLPATVTRPAPDDDAIATSVIWLPPVDEPELYGTDRPRYQPRRAVCVPRVDVPTMPNGTLIVAAEVLGGPVKTWRSDGLLRAADVDLWRIAVTEIATP